MNKDNKLDLIKTLRETTGLGILDCKKALFNANYDLALAIKYLKESGKSKFLKKANRDAGEGVTLCSAIKNDALLIIVKCETDFVAKTNEYIQNVREIGYHALERKISEVSDCMEMTINEQKTKNLLVELSHRTGENIFIDTIEIIEKQKDDCFGIYNHSNNKISVLIVLQNSKDEELARNIAMHVCAMNPEYVDVESINKKTLDQLKSNIKKSLDDSIKQKPQQVVEKIIEGKLRKELGEIVLLEQEYVKDKNFKIKDLLEKNETKIVFVKRIEI